MDGSAMTSSNLIVFNSALTINSTVANGISKIIIKSQFS